MLGKLSKKSIVDGKSITEKLCTIWWMIMMKSTAAHSSESFRFCLENYSNNEAVTSSTVIRVTQAWVLKFLKTNMS
jgi:hypothetical protein